MVPLVLAESYSSLVMFVFCINDVVFYQGKEEEEDERMKIVKQLRRMDMREREKGRQGAKGMTIQR